MTFPPTWIQNFPLPPSVNNMLASVNGRLIKTGSHKKYRQDCLNWSVINHKTFWPIRNELLGIQTQMEREGKIFALSIDFLFVFHVEQLIGKKGQLKALDADNRLKPARDALAACLTIDDKHFVSGYYEAVTTSALGGECCIIRIRQTNLRDVSQIEAMFPRAT